MARVQLATSQLELKGIFPFFKPTDVVASASSLEPKLLHRVSLQDLLIDRETTDHSAMLSGAKLFFTILVWTPDGKWDYVWSPAAAAPGQAPDTIKLKGRRVGVRLVSLYCSDDSDSVTYGEADFSMIVRLLTRWVSALPGRPTRSISWASRGFLGARRRTRLPPSRSTTRRSSTAPVSDISRSLSPRIRFSDKCRLEYDR